MRINSYTLIVVALAVPFLGGILGQLALAFVWAYILLLGFGLMVLALSDTVKSHITANRADNTKFKTKSKSKIIFNMFMVLCVTGWLFFNGYVITSIAMFCVYGLFLSLIPSIRKMATGKVCNSNQ